MSCLLPSSFLTERLDGDSSWEVRKAVSEKKKILFGLFYTKWYRRDEGRMVDMPMLFQQPDWIYHGYASCEAESDIQRFIKTY